MDDVIVKVLWSGKQARVTVPKVVVDALGWETARYLVLSVNEDNQVVLERLSHGETATGQITGD